MLRRIHVRDDPVGDDEQHLLVGDDDDDDDDDDDEQHLVVGGLVLVHGGDLGHMVDHRGEVGRAVQLDRVEGLVVGCHHPLDALAVGA